MTVVVSMPSLTGSSGIQIPHGLHDQIEEKGRQHGEEQPAVAALLPGLVTRPPGNRDADREESPSDKKLIQ